MESIGLQNAPFHLERFLFLLTKPKIEALWQISLAFCDATQNGKPTQR